MEYKKPATSFVEQLELLKKRGLVIPDEAFAQQILSEISYYRLSVYCIPFQDVKDKFKAGTALEDVFRLYRFDRDLRTLIFKWLEQIEVAARCSITYSLSHKYGPFGYLKAENFSNFFQHAKWLEGVRYEISRSRELFIEHYRIKYPKSTDLPLWMASETFSFNSLSRLFAGMRNNDKRPVASNFNVDHKLFPSWLHSLCYVRNLCAHHGRLWNRELSIEPRIPYTWAGFQPVGAVNPAKKVFSFLSVMNYLLKQLNKGEFFKPSLIKLLSDYPQVNVRHMGFFDDWENHPIWK